MLARFSGRGIYGCGFLEGCRSNEIAYGQPLFFGCLYNFRGFVLRVIGEQSPSFRSVQSSASIARTFPHATMLTKSPPKPTMRAYRSRHHPPAASQRLVQSSKRLGTSEQMATSLTTGFCFFFTTKPFCPRKAAKKIEDRTGFRRTPQ